MNAKLQQAGDVGDRLHDSTPPPPWVLLSPTPTLPVYVSRYAAQRQQKYPDKGEEKKNRELLPLRMAHHNYVNVRLW